MTSRPRPAISQRAGEVWSRVTTGIYGRGAISFMLATAGVNVSNFLFHVVVSRLLGPAHYGVVGAILSILNFLVVPIGAVQLAVTQAVIYQTARHERYSLGPIVRRGALGGLAAMVAFAALTPALESFLHIHSAVPLLVAAAWVPLAIVAALAIAASALLFFLLRATVGIRSREPDEFDGLDLSEYDLNAYPDFQQTTIKSYHLREM